MAGGWLWGGASDNFRAHREEEAHNKKPRTADQPAEATPQTSAAVDREVRAFLLRRRHARNPFRQSPDPPWILAHSLARKTRLVKALSVMAAAGTPSGGFIGRCGRESLLPDHAANRSRREGAVILGDGANGMQFVFMKIKDGKLDVSDTYKSDWYGKETLKRETVSGEGRVIVGICGRCGWWIDTLGLIWLDPDGRGL